MYVCMYVYIYIHTHAWAMYSNLAHAQISGWGCFNATLGAYAENEKSVCTYHESKSAFLAAAQSIYVGEASLHTG